MKATVPHLGWPVVFSILRNPMPTKPQGVANALYHVPYLCAENAPQPALSGPLPSQELVDEYFELVVKSQKNGCRVVSDGDFEKINAALWDRNYHAHDGADSVSVEFELSWEDWLDYRYIQTTDSKALNSITPIICVSVRNADTFPEMHTAGATHTPPGLRGIPGVNCLALAIRQK